MHNSIDNKYVISEFYSFEADRNLIKESIESNSTITIKCILQKADTLNRNGRVYPFKILKREVDKYQVLVNERSAMGECVPAGTQIFTSDGWKNIESVKTDDNVFTLNLETNSLEVQPVLSTIKKNYNDDLIHIYNNSSLDMMITKKHKVVLWDRYNKPYIITGQELFNRINSNDPSLSKSSIKNTSIWTGDEPEYFNLPNSDIKIKTEDWAAFLGIYISEGHCAGSKGGELRNSIGITQKKELTKNLVIELLDRMPFSYYKATNGRQFIFSDENLVDHLRILGNSSQKFIPEYAKNWSPRLLNILLDWLLIGDGLNRKSRNGELMQEYATISDKLKDDVFEIMLKCGHGVSTHVRIPQDRLITDESEITHEIELEDGTIELQTEIVKTQRLIKAENSNALHIIRSKTAKSVYLDSRFVKAEYVSHNDNVYCVSVPNKTWLMKYNNKVSWTHNCDHPDSAVISLANVSHLVTRMWWEGTTLYGEIEIAETPSGNILKGLLKSGIKLGISSRGVGSVKNIKGSDVVQEDFELIGFDVVSSPSTPGAYLFKEGRQWGLTKLVDADHKILKQEDVQDRTTSAYNKLIDLSKDNFWNN